MRKIALHRCKISDFFLFLRKRIESRLLQYAGSHHLFSF